VDFVVGDVVRQGFGFANPNHAAAAICAAFPFCWGWRGGWLWIGRVAGVALCVMLAMTYSRTGALVLVCEIVALLLGRKTLSAGMIGRVERVETCRNFYTIYTFYMVKKDARSGRPCHSGGRSCDCRMVDVAETGARRRDIEQAKDLACWAETFRGESAWCRIRQFRRARDDVHAA